MFKMDDFVYKVLKEWEIVNDSVLREPYHVLVPFNKTFIPQKLRELISFTGTNPKWVAKSDCGEVDDISILDHHLNILFRTDNETEVGAWDFIVSNDVQKGKDKFKLEPKGE